MRPPPHPNPHSHQPGWADAAESRTHRSIACLLVEDHEACRRLTVIALEHAGFQVDAATSGEEALALLAENRYDVAVLDLRLPGISGIHLLQGLRTFPEHSELPVIGWTASVELVGLALSAGMREVVIKPNGSLDVLAAIERAIGPAARPPGPNVHARPSNQGATS